MKQLKKVFVILAILISFFLIYFLQANFFSWFTIAGVKPNLFVILVLLIGLFAGKKIGAILGLFIGIYIDIVIGRTIGFSCILFAIIGLLGEYFDKNFSKESKITIMLMVIGSTIIYEIGNYIFNIIKLGMDTEMVPFFKILGIEVLYNTILTIILYPLIQIAGTYIEDVFKGKKILTRYF